MRTFQQNHPEKEPFNRFNLPKVPLSDLHGFSFSGIDLKQRAWMPRQLQALLGQLQDLSLQGLAGTWRAVRWYAHVPPIFQIVHTTMPLNMTIFWQWKSTPAQAQAKPQNPRRSETKKNGRSNGFLQRIYHWVMSQVLEIIGKLKKLKTECDKLVNVGMKEYLRKSKKKSYQVPKNGKIIAPTWKRDEHSINVTFVNSWRP